MQVVSGYLGRVTISVPWSALMSDSCHVEVTGLTLSVMPRLVSSPGEDFSEYIFGPSFSIHTYLTTHILKSNYIQLRLLLFYSLIYLLVHSIDFSLI